MLVPKWRGLKLGLLALRKLIDLHESCRLVIQPCPSEDSSVLGAKVRLRRYFKKLGFRRIGKTDYYGLSTAHVTPKFEDVLRGSESRKVRRS